MAKRFRLGLVFSYYENWIGGTYYFLNLISSLKRLPKDEQPLLFIFSNQVKEKEMVKATKYKYVKFVGDKPTLLARIKRRIRHSAENKLPVCDVLFTVYNSKLEGNYWETHKNKIYWIPDFQEHYYPEFTTIERLVEKKERQRELVQLKAPLVFSSRNAMNDFNQFYPENDNSQYILQFAVDHPKLYSKPIKFLLNKYGLPDRYFVCPNQFWKHKNHQIVIEALEILQSLDIVVVFTGKEADPRNPNHVKSLKEKVKNSKLESKVKFLGFIDYEELLQLIYYSIALIQPSDFEGWSTSIEDAKSLGKLVIASDLAVHREQLGEQGIYFGGRDSLGLANILLNLHQQKEMVRIEYDYDNKLRSFATDFLEICKQQIK